MADAATPLRAGSVGSPSDLPPSLIDVLRAVVDFTRRHVRLISFALIVTVAFGEMYMISIKPTYTAVATLILDMRNVTFAQQKSMVSDIPLDSAFVESQLEVLKSVNVMVPVIEKLHLKENPEFVGSTGGPLGDFVNAVSRRINPSYELTEFELMERAQRVLLSNMGVKRLGLSFVIEVTFRSINAERAARVANAITDAYLVDQAGARIEAARKATEWLQASLDTLREQMFAADRAVVAFKSKNKIVDAGGHLISDQQLSDLNSQLTAAGLQMAEARARWNRIDTILQSMSPYDGAVDATVTDTLKSDVINKLRSQYLDLANREADWSSRYGQDHMAAISLRNQMGQIRSSIIDELRRIAETNKSEYEIAKQREQDIQRQLSQVIANSELTSQAQITLRQLESTANGYRSLYDESLHRQLETVQAQSYPMVEGRVISPASVPLKVSWPRASVVLAVSAVLGLTLGIVLALLLDLRTVLTAPRV